MSSISAALAAHGIMIPTAISSAGQAHHEDDKVGSQAALVYSNPGSLNAWLKSNNGYTSDNDLGR